MSVQTVRIDLLGTSFVIQTDETEQYIDSLLAYYRRKLDVVARDSRVEDPLKQSILATIYIVDELFRARVESSVHKDLSTDVQRELSVITERLIARIDTSLLDDSEPADTQA